MAATDDLRSLIDRTNRDLDDWSDFAEHTKEVWRTFRLWVEAGNQLISQNQATGTTTADLVSLSQFYLTENLAPLVLQRFISVFEAFVFDFLRILLLRNPGHLPTASLGARRTACFALRNSWDLLKKICNDLGHAGIKVFSIRK